MADSLADQVRNALRRLGGGRQVRGKQPRPIGQCFRCGRTIMSNEGYVRPLGGIRLRHLGRCPTFTERMEIK